MNTYILSIPLFVSGNEFYILLAFLCLITFINYLLVRNLIFRSKSKQINLKKQIIKQNHILLEQKKELQSNYDLLSKQTSDLENLSYVAKYSNAAVMILDPDGNWEWVNEGFTRMYGYTYESFVRNFGKNILKTSYYPGIDDLFKQCTIHKKTIIYECANETTFGTKIWTQTTLNPVLDDNGNVIKLIAIDTDISRLKDSEGQILKQNEEITYQTKLLQRQNKTLEELSIVAQYTDHAVMILDCEGNFIWVNDGFVKMYEFSFEQFTAKLGSNILKTSFNPKIQKLFRECIENKTSVNYDCLNVTKSGKKLWTHTILTPVLNENGEVHKIVGIDSSINDLKEALAEISMQKEEIETQRDELNKSNSTKDFLFSVIAHDLKNPLHGIMGLSDMLASKYSSYDQETVIKFLGAINESTNSLYLLVENMLNWARSQTQSLKYKPAFVELQSIVDTNINLLIKTAENKNVSLVSVVADETFVFADAEMLKAVYRNLISNAIKFTSQGTIEISANREGNKIKCTIKDSGTGMSPETLSAISANNDYSTDGTENEKGTGLGLRIVRQFLSAHGTYLSIHSVEGEGSEFSFYLNIDRTN